MMFKKKSLISIHELIRIYLPRPPKEERNKERKKKMCKKCLLNHSSEDIRNTVDISANANKPTSKKIVFSKEYFFFLALSLWTLIKFIRVFILFFTRSPDGFLHSQAAIFK